MLQEGIILHVLFHQMHKTGKVYYRTRCLLIPIINLPGAYDDLSIVGNYIVILEHLGRNIGILKTETHLVRILAKSILEDRITGQKSFVHNGKTYQMLDISQLYKELGIEKCRDFALFENGE